MGIDQPLAGGSQVAGLDVPLRDGGGGGGLPVGRRRQLVSRISASRSSGIPASQPHCCCSLLALGSLRHQRRALLLCSLWPSETQPAPWLPCAPTLQLVNQVTQGVRLPLPASPEDLPGPPATRPTPAQLSAYCELLGCCWAQAPAHRPPFGDVVDSLRWAGPGCPS